MAGKQIPLEHGVRIGKALRGIKRNGTLNGVHGFTTNHRQVTAWLLAKGLIRKSGNGTYKVAIGDQAVEKYAASKSVIDALEDCPLPETEQVASGFESQDCGQEIEGTVEEGEDQQLYSGDLIHFAAETARDVKSGKIGYKEGMTVAALLKNMVDMKKAELEAAKLRAKGLEVDEIPLCPANPPAEIGSDSA